MMKAEGRVSILSRPTKGLIFWLGLLIFIHLINNTLLHSRCLSDILATSCTTEAQIQLLHFFCRDCAGFCLLDTEYRTVFHVLVIFCFLFYAPLCHQYLAPYAVLSSKYI